MAANSVRTHRSAALFIFAGTLAVYLATAGGSLATQDAVAVYYQTKSIVERGAIDVPLEISGERWLGVDGRYHLPFGIGQAIYNVPFYAAGKLLVSLTGVRVGGSDEPILKACVALGNTVAASICVAVSFLLAWRITNSRRAACSAALLLAFGSPLWLYSKFGFNAAVTAAALVTGIYGLYVGKLSGRLRPTLWGAVAIAGSMMVRHEMLLAGLAALVWVAAPGRLREGTRRKTILAVSSVLSAAVVAWLGFNFIRFGNPLESGHTPAFGIEGFAGLLVSPAASIFLYAPAAALGMVGIYVLRRDQHPAASLLGGVTITLFVFYSALEDWIGTRSYGPRYLVPVMSLLYAAASAGLERVRRQASALRMACVSLAIVSVLVQLPSITLNFVTVRGLTDAPTPNQAPFSWTSAPVRLNTGALGHAVATNWTYLRGGPPGSTVTSSAGSPPASTELSSRLSFSLDFWWLYLYYLGKLTATRALLAPIVLLVIAAPLLWKAATCNVREFSGSASASPE